MAVTVYPSSLSPTGYSDNNGTPVNADGTPYTATSSPLASTGLNSLPTSSIGTNLTAGQFNQIGGTASGLQTLTPGQTTAKQIALEGMPNITEGANQISPTQYSGAVLQSNQEQAPVLKFAEGQSVPSPTYSYTQTGYPHMSPSFTRGHAVQLYGTPGKTGAVGDLGNKLIGMNQGGSTSNMPEGHHPQFYSEGGLQHAYVQGDGDGTSDSVPAMLASGEFVIPADVVSSLGNGDNDAGAKTLAEFLKTIREHKRAADAKHLPPDSKGPLAYLTDAKRKVKA